MPDTLTPKSCEAYLDLKAVFDDNCATRKSDVTNDIRRCLAVDISLTDRQDKPSFKRHAGTY